MASYPLTVQVLGPAHREQATQLLASQFCEREPLCRILGLTVEDVLPVFRGQIDHVISQGLSMVTVNRSGDVQAALTIEDQFAPFVPDPGSINPKLQIINSLLDSLVFPASLQPTGACEVYYCGLAAVTQGQRRSGVLLILMILESYFLEGQGVPSRLRESDQCENWPANEKNRANFPAPNFYLVSRNISFGI